MENKIKLWTRQHKDILKDLASNSVYRVKAEYIRAKNDSISDYFFQLYDWYVKKAERIVPRPQGVVYPIWLSSTSDLMLQPTEDTVVLELEVDINLVVFSSFDKWGYVVNYWYVPLNEQDEIKHNKELRMNGIGDESALIMSSKGNFYPLLKNKILKSWERIFDIHYSDSDTKQATLWEIKKEWIKEIIEE